MRYGAAPDQRHERAHVGPQMRSVGDVAERCFMWRERSYPRQWWRRMFVRTVAQTDVVAPDEGSYTVRVIRVLWPPGRGVGLDTGSPLDVVEVLANLFVWRWRVVWGVRVLAGSGRPLGRPLVYGEEMRGRGDALLRAREVAEGLSQGRKP